MIEKNSIIINVKNNYFEGDKDNRPPFLMLW